jgi:hypothetical protein
LSHGPEGRSIGSVPSLPSPVPNGFSLPFWVFAGSVFPARDVTRDTEKVLYSLKEVFFNGTPIFGGNKIHRKSQGKTDGRVEDRSEADCA